MPKPVTAYRVFIASPGGLEEERKVFRATTLRHNEDAAFDLLSTNSHTTSRGRRHAVGKTRFHYKVVENITRW